MLSDHRNGLSRGDVVVRSPLFFAGNGVEILFDNLLSPRQSVAPAHEEIMADRSGISVFRGRVVAVQESCVGFEVPAEARLVMVTAPATLCAAKLCNLDQCLAQPSPMMDATQSAATRRKLS
jgi:hypothetical protein